ncbi:MAG: macro domain-containing protein [Gemmatimonadaceae bacterium]|nr:macro domain-containing protein [Gemmatimonadaceae bacterium]
MTGRPAVEVRVDDLAFYEGDAVARPSTARLAALTPVIRRLELAAGPRLLDRLHVHEPLPVGSAVVTGAGDLPAELMIHGVIQSETETVTRDGVRRALRSVLQRAVDWQLRSIGIAPFGLGAGNLDVEDSAQALADALEAHVARAATFPVAITIVTETADEADIFRHCMSYRSL